MAGNPVILTLIALLPVILILFAVTLFFLSRRARSFLCPLCAKRISKDAIQSGGVRCPHCDWHARPRTEVHDSEFPRIDHVQ